MKIRNMTLIISMALLLAVGLAIPSGRTAFSAETDNSHPYLGVLLDMSPLPELLTKHLGLSPGQGVRIRNIQKNSPAEEAGLERDDIIIRIQDKDIYKYESVVFAVQEAKVGEEISIEIIHLGQRKTMKIKLDESKGEPEWKFPPEPELKESVRPGRIFTFKPGENVWSEIFSDDIPTELQQNIDKILKYNEYREYSDDQDFKITIEGNPENEDSTITISKGDTKHQTSIKELDKLPEEYREAAERALKNARGKKGEDSFWDSIQPPTDFEKFFQQPHSQYRLPERMFQQDSKMFDEIQKQMHQLTERIKELEKSQSELLDRLTEKQQMQKTQEKQESIL